jgi:tetratricopeptide (TPR) repeat protein
MRNKTRGRRSLASLTITATLAATALRASPQELPSASIPPVIRQMIEHARRELTQGNPAAAADLFERAAEHGEYAEAEVGEVRARLWAGQFRHAVAISSVVAGEHPESAEAQALLGYIEDRTGYTAQALQRLRNERQTRPQEAAPVAAEAEVLVDRHSPREAIELIDQWVAEHGVQPDLCRLRGRAVLVQNFEADPPPRSSNPCEAPVAQPSATAGESRWSEATTSRFPATLGSLLTAGNGFITDEGRRVITLRRLIDSPSVSIWVRNARGELRRARLERQDEHTSPIATLSLSAPFAADQSLRHDGSAPRNAHGLCFALGFPAAMSTDAMLPVVTPCFAFDLHAADGTLNINIPLSAGERGSPVFDAEGRLVGLADPAAGSNPVGDARPIGKPKALTTVIRTTTGEDSPQRTAASQSQATIAMPELYERLAPAIVQVVTFPSTAPVTPARE